MYKFDPGHKYWCLNTGILKSNEAVTLLLNAPMHFFFLKPSAFFIIKVKKVTNPNHTII